MSDVDPHAEPAPPLRDPLVPEAMGPIQMLVFGFAGNRFKGEILPELERLKRNEIIRIIDMLVVRKDGSGNVMVSTASDLDWEDALSFGSYVGALAGFATFGPEGMERGAMAGAAELADGHLFDDDDVFRVTQSLPNGTTAALVLLEHLWMKPMREAIERADGVELANEWLRPEDIVSVDDEGARDRPPTT